MKLKYIYLGLVIILVWVLNMSNSAGHGSASSCAQPGCHGGGAGTTTIDSLSLYDLTTLSYASGTYVPGHTYSVTLIGKNSASLVNFGFAISDGGNGTFSSPMTGTKINGSGSLWEHAAPLAGAAGQYIATTTWTAPTGGNVTFSGFLNAVNFNTAVTGDVTSSQYLLTLTPQILYAKDSIYIQSGTNPMCSGSSITFRSIATNGGLIPSYQWKVNGATVATGISYTTDSLNDNDVVTCVMNSTLAGVQNNPATSNPITVHVPATFINGVSISSNVSSICAGDTVVFAATPNAGILTPQYAWFKNGVKLLGQSSSTLTMTGLTNTDSIYCVVKASNVCRDTAYAMSNKLAISINPSPVLTNVNPITICTGQMTLSTNWTSSMPNTVFDWTNSNTSIGLDSAGTGNIMSFPAYNYSTNLDTAIITIKPNVAGCHGLPVSFPIVVKPAPNVFPISNLGRCENSTQNAIILNANIPGATIKWYNNNAAIGMLDSGVNYIPTFTTSSGFSGDSISGTIIYTASYNGCIGSSSTFKYEVDKKPTITPTQDIITCKNKVVPSINFSSSNTATTYNWSNSLPVIGLAPFGFGAIPTFVAQIDTSSQVTSTILVSTKFNHCDGDKDTFSIIVNGSLRPSVSVVPNANVVCIGDTVIFRAIPTIGGSNPIYNWLLNGNLINGANDSIWKATSIADGDSVVCYMTSNDPCAFPLFATSTPVRIAVKSHVTPTLSITSSMSQICSGSPVTFSANSYGEGPSPVYNWYKNGIIVGSNSPTYIDATLTSADSVFCYLYSSLGCAIPSIVFSSKLSVTVSTAYNMVVNMDPTTTIICQGDTVLFYANIKGQGPNATYNWYKNGALVSSNQIVYSSVINAITDSVSFLINANNSCVTPSSIAIKKGMTIVHPAAIVTVSPSAYGQFCAGDSIRIAARGGDTGYQYLWSNGVNDTAFYTDTTQSYYLTVSGVGLCTRTYGPITSYRQPLPTIPYISKYNDSTLQSTLSINYQWQANHVDILDSISQKLRFYDSTQYLYRVKVVNTAGCISYSPDFNPYQAAISNASNSLVSIYPTINQGKFTVDFGALDGYKSIDIYNIAGQLVYTTATNNRKEMILMPSSTAGLYILKSETTRGQELLKFEIK